MPRRRKRKAIAKLANVRSMCRQSGRLLAGSRASGATTPFSVLLKRIFEEGRKSIKHPTTSSCFYLTLEATQSSLPVWRPSQLMGSLQ